MGTLELISQLRNTTGAGMMDCKKALESVNGDMSKAEEALRSAGVVKATKRAGKIAAEGLVLSYIHGAGKIGVLVEVNCETDFVGKTEAFKAFVYEIAMQIAGANPKYLSREDVPAEELEKEKAFYKEQLKAEGLAPDVWEHSRLEALSLDEVLLRLESMEPRLDSPLENHVCGIGVGAITTLLLADIVNSQAY